MNEDKKFALLPLKKRALELMTDWIGANEDWYNRDETKLFWKHIKVVLKRGHILLIQFNGGVSEGKSTAGIYVAMKVNEILKDMNEINPDYEDDFTRLIFANNTEFWKKAKNLTFKYIDDKGEVAYKGSCVEIDEDNKMIKTGLNSSTEQVTYEHKSDVFAQQKLHRVYCSPNGISDQNVNIILFVEPAQKEYGFTDCKLKWRDIETGKTIPIGRVRFNVKDLLKKDYMIKYRKKKFKAMELFDKEGIKDYRDFIDAEIILDGYHKYKKRARIEKVNTDIIRSGVRTILNKKSEFYSFLGNDEMVSNIKALLDMEHSISKYEDKLAKIRKNTKDDIETISKQKENLVDAIADEIENRDFFIKNYERIVKIREEYDALMD